MRPDEKWLLPPDYKSKIVWRLSSRVVLTAVGMFSKIWLEWLNKVKVYNLEILNNTLDARIPGQGVLTVSNHHSCLDDPILWGCLHWRYLLNTHLIRWTLAADDICFTKYLHALFFTLGKTLPVHRGYGVYQKGVDFMLERINDGEWVHMFPEGKVNVDKECMRLKWGIGRLISESKNIPVVLPFWHEGMDSVLPNKKPYIPRIRQQVTLLIGKPMYFKKDVELLKSLQKTPTEIRKHITDKIQKELFKLRERAEILHQTVKK